MVDQNIQLAQSIFYYKSWNNDNMMVIAIQYFFLLIGSCSFSINVARPGRLAGRHLDDISLSPFPHRLSYEIPTRHTIVFSN